MKYFSILGISFILLIFTSCQSTVNEPASTFTMSQNYPNPFTDTTVILYGIPYSGSNARGPWVQIVVKDPFNQTIATIVNIYNHPAGHDFRVVWNGRGNNYEKVQPGMYIIELQELIPSSEKVIVHVKKIALKQ